MLVYDANHARDDGDQILTVLSIILFCLYIRSLYISLSVFKFEVVLRYGSKSYYFNLNKYVYICKGQNKRRSS